MQKPLFSQSTREALDQLDSQGIDYRQRYEESIHFMEMTEVLTYDSATATRISSFLHQQGVWEASDKKTDKTSASWN